MSDESIPGEFDRINKRLDAGDVRMGNIERQLSENTRLTAESGEVIKDVRDALVFARIGTKLIKWLGGVGAVIVTTFTIYTQWRKP